MRFLGAALGADNDCSGNGATRGRGHRAFEEVAGMFEVVFSPCRLLMTEVPQNSGPLSLTDRDKAAKGMVYKIKADRIEVLVKNMAKLGGMSDAQIEARANTVRADKGRHGSRLERR
jgi:hypothetical protein